MTVRILLCFDVALFHSVLSEGVLGLNKLENNSWAVACTPGVKQGKEGLCKLPGKEVVHLHPCVAFCVGALSWLVFFFFSFHLSKPLQGCVRSPGML